MDIKTVEQLVVDESAIALVVTGDHPMPVEARVNISDMIKSALPSLKVPVFVLDSRLKLQVLQASDAKTLQQVIGEE